MAQFDPQAPLWKNTLGEQANDQFSGQRERLRNAFSRMRENAALIAGDVASDMPEFTGHDVTHLDALWELADLIAGDDPGLTPIEAFVLGAAFLCHDLAMTLSAYPGREQDLRALPGWADALQSAALDVLTRRLAPTELEAPPREVLTLAIKETLRERHALHAERLGTLPWIDPDTDTALYLLEDQDLRGSLGFAIGQVAGSHWWSFADLSKRLAGTYGAPVGFPPDWTLDLLRVSCLLRVADAAHLDARRAPPLLRIARGISGLSQEHWKFQSHLHQPRREDDRLVFTAGEPFGLDECHSWWLCSEALRMLDHELRGVDALLADANRKRFAARGVARVDDPSRLTSLIPVHGWEPVPAEISVSDVASLVQKLGGVALYGDDPRIAIRELVENGADAIRASRIVSQDAIDDEIRVQLSRDTDGIWLEVSDNGIGMSPQVLTTALLDFGRSYWLEKGNRAAFPGLLAGGFQPTGEFGIGFFSIFLLGDRVVVRSKALADSSSTAVLEFGSGILERPILRRASPNERLERSGTSVRIRLQDEGVLEAILTPPYGGEQLSLDQICQWLFPTLDVSISTREFEGPWEGALEANDWMQLSPLSLLKRIAIGSASTPWRMTEDQLEELSSSLLPVFGSSGEILGRLTVAWISSDESWIRTVGAPVTVGGARTSTEGLDWTGVVLGRAVRAARDVAVPLVEAETMAEWASTWARKFGTQHDPELEASICQHVLALGGSGPHLRIARNAQEWLTARDIEDWAKSLHAILLLDPGALMHAIPRWRDVELRESVLMVSTDYRPAIQSFFQLGRAEVWPFDVRQMKDLPQLLWPGTVSREALFAISKAWDCSPRQLVPADPGTPPKQQVGTYRGEEITAPVVEVKNPKGAS